MDKKNLCVFYLISQGNCIHNTAIVCATRAHPALNCDIVVFRQLHFSTLPLLWRSIYSATTLNTVTLNSSFIVTWEKYTYAYSIVPRDVFIMY